MPTLIWLACVATAWTAASGPVVGYHVKLGEALQPDVAAVQSEVCIPEKYTPTELRVQGFDAAGNVGEWSDPFVLERVHDFDSDGDGILGIDDFARLYRDFGIRYLPSGVAVRRE